MYAQQLVPVIGYLSSGSLESDLIVGVLRISVRDSFLSMMTRMTLRCPVVRTDYGYSEFDVSLVVTYPCPHCGMVHQLLHDRRVPVVPVRSGRNAAGLA